MVADQPAQQLARLLGLLGAAAELRPARSARSTVSSARVIIFDQSWTASSTSRAPRAGPAPGPATRLWSTSVRAGGRISRCIQDSGRTVGSPLASRRSDDPVQRAAQVAQHQELRVEDLADAPALPEHLHGHRVDQERPVVGDHLDHRRAAGGPAVGGQRSGSGSRWWPGPTAGSAPPGSGSRPAPAGPRRYAPRCRSDRRGGSSGQEDPDPVGVLAQLGRDRRPRARPPPRSSRPSPAPAPPRMSSRRPLPRLPAAPRRALPPTLRRTPASRRDTGDGCLGAETTGSGMT